ncbi:MAG: nickel-dependent lactate racemase [Syntrophorhabdales bacterium]|jgi:nickel-dependent lactate racemase
MRIDLKYGRDVIPFEPPGAWTVSVVDHGRPAARPFEETLLAALEAPYDSVPFEEWVARRDLLVIVSDVTRYTGAEKLLPELMGTFLKKARRVRVLFALGNHRKQTEAEQRALVSDSVYKAVPCVDHDCFDEHALSPIGVTPSGLDVALNSLVLEADATLVTGAISFHYLAGFGGGRKCIIPGIAAYQTILDAHKRVFNKDKPGKHERAQTGILEGNPMHEAIMEGIELVKKPLFLINTIFDDERRLLNIFAGDIKTSHEAGCAWYHAHFSTTVAQKADVAVVSVGGYPKDIDFIQSHKALEHARHAVKDGGTIILLGKCEDGLGNRYFLPWFDYPSIEAMEPRVKEADKVYAQTAYSTRMKAERYRIMLVSDLPGDEVRKMGMAPRRTLEEAVASLPQGREMLCHIMPEGSKTLVRQQ